MQSTCFTLDSTKRQLGIPGVYEISPGTSYKNMKRIKLDFFSGCDPDSFLDEGEQPLPISPPIIPTTGPFVIPDTDIFDVYYDDIDTPMPKEEVPFNCSKFKSRTNNGGPVPVVKPPISGSEQTEPLFTYSDTKVLLGSFSMGGTFQTTQLLNTLGNKVNALLEPVTYGNQFCIFEFATDYNNAPYSVISRLFASELGVPANAPPGTLYIGCLYLRPRVYNTSSQTDAESFPSMFHYLGCERGLFKIGGDQQYVLYRSLNFSLYNTFVLTVNLRLRLHIRNAFTNTFIDTGSSVTIPQGILTLEAVAERIFSLFAAIPFVNGPFDVKIINNSIYLYATNSKTTNTYNAIKIIQTRGNNTAQYGGYIAEWLGFDLTCGIYIVFDSTDPPETEYKVRLRPGFVYNQAASYSPYTDVLEQQVYGPGQYEDSVTLAYQQLKKRLTNKWLYRDIKLIEEYIQSVYRDWNRNQTEYQKIKAMIEELLSYAFDIEELKPLLGYELETFKRVLNNEAEYNLVTHPIDRMNYLRTERTVYPFFYRTKQKTYSTVFGRLLLNMYAKDYSLRKKSIQFTSAEPNYVRGYTLIPRDYTAIYMRIRNYPMTQTTNSSESFSFLLTNHSYYETNKTKCFAFKENSDYQNVNIFNGPDYQIKNFIIEFVDIDGKVIGNMGEHVFRLTIEYTN